MPDAAQKLKNIPEGTLPYISLADLMVFKINSCGLRAQMSKRLIDAADAQNLLEELAAHSPLTLTSRQRGIVEAGLADVVSNSNMPREWWAVRLGLAESYDEANEYWTWSDQYQNWYHMNEDGTCVWAEQGESSTRQQSKSKDKRKGKGKRS